MEPVEILRSIVSNLSGLPPDELRSGLVLDEIKLRGSIKRARLDAELRKRFKTSFPAAYMAKTFGELERAVLGAPPPSSAPDSSTAPGRSVSSEGRRPNNGKSGMSEGAPSSLTCGIDLEMVENLPTVADYWSDPFYTGNFTPAEIAYCSLQTKPKTHFAARWAAKEALKKCDNALLSAEMSQFELHRGERGQVSLVRLSGGKPVPLPHSVSISHSDVFAVAVVVRLPSSADQSAALGEIAAQLAAALETPKSN